MKTYAEQLSDIYMRASDLKAEADAVIEAAKAEGINVKALRKVAKEMTMEASKLATKLDDEAQLSMFRDEVDLLHRKGLHGEAVKHAKTSTDAALAYLKGSRMIKEASA